MPPPLEWLARLLPRLKIQAAHARLYDGYYSGDRELRIVVREYRDVFGAHADFTPPKTNVSAVGVNAVAERLVVDGFRVGEDDDSAGSQAAWDIWLRNELDVMSAVGHTESLAKGTAFLLVWPDVDGQALISVEDPEQMVVARSGEPPYNVEAAVKLWIDEWTGQPHANVYLTEGIYKYVYTRSAAGSTAYDLIPDPLPITGIPTPAQVIAQRMQGWQEYDFVAAPPAFAGKVPVVELANRARLIRAPESDLKPVAPLADTHSKILADLVIAASFGAVPIRTATGIQLPRDPDTGEPVSPFDVRADRAMVSENPAAKFGTLPAADLAGYVSALDVVLRDIRIITRVPQHYYGGGAGSGTSGETLKAAEASLVRRIDGALPRFGLGWRQAIGLALAIEQPALTDAPMTVRWADTQTRVEAQQVDAAQKLEAMGVPLEIVLIEHLKMDPATVRRAMAMREETPPPTPVVAPATAVPAPDIDVEVETETPV